MKTVIVNGGPRKEWNTAQLLKSAQKGAEAAGAETEYVDLYDLRFTGCRSCLACKRKGLENPCRCFFKDELSPVIEHVHRADHLIMGSPIYFGEPTGQLRCFLERVVYPTLSYNSFSSIFTGKIDVDVFLTMGETRDSYDRNYLAKMEAYFAPFRSFNGVVTIHPVCDTAQVKDYSQYEMAGIPGAHKLKLRETEFPAMLKMAYQIGERTC